MFASAVTGDMIDRHGIYMMRVTARSDNAVPALAAAIALVTGCLAPRTDARAVGVDEAPIGDDAYILSCKLSASCRQATAFDRMRERAGQLCPGGFAVLDSADGSRSTYVRTVHGVQPIRQADVALVVQCHPPRTAD